MAEKAEPGGEETKKLIVYEMRNKGLRYLDKQIYMKNILINNQIKTLNLLGNIQISSIPDDLPSLISLVLSKNQYNEIPESIINSILSYPLLESLDLSRNNLKNIPNEILQSEKLKRFYLFENQLSSISFEAMSNLHILDIGSNRFEYIPEIPINLQALCADFNFITDLNLAHSNLTQLSFARNMIDSISVNCILSSLMKLDLSYNRLSQLPDLSRIAPLLKQINLSYNKLNDFPMLPLSVADIKINNNCIQKIPDLSVFKDLLAADFSNNLIEYVSYLPANLQDISFKNNNIDDIASIESKELVRIDFDGNLLTEPPLIDTFKVAELHFAYNKFKTFKFTGFDKAITRLYLDNNELEEIPVFIMEIPQLKYLYVQCNQIRYVPEEISKSSITYLNLSMNPLDECPEFLPENLDTLLISNCNLDSISNAIVNLQDLIYLDVSSNNIGEMPYLPSITTLIASQNNLINFPDLNQHIRVVNLSCNKIRKIFDIFSYPYMRSLDLSNNFITNFPRHISLPNIVDLKLNNNQFVSTILEHNTFPKIRFLDVSNSYISPMNFIENIHVRASSRINPHYSLLKTDQYSSFAQTHGINDISEDYIIGNTSNDKTFFGIFSGFRFGPYASRCLTDFFMKKYCESDFDEVNLQEYFHKIIHDSKSNDPYSAVVVLLQDFQIISAIYGNYTVIIVDNDGSIRHNENSQQYISEEVQIGNSNVYKQQTEIQFNVLDITQADKWIIITSSLIYQKISLNMFQSVVSNSTSSKDIAFKLLNIARTNENTSNLSIIVVDIKKQQT